MSDDERRAERRRRMDELLAAAEADVARTRAAREKADNPGPVVERKRGTWWGSLLGVLILLALSAVLLGAAATVSRWTGAPYDEARKVGTATVEECERRGPISLKGFGFYDRCTLEVRWGTGPSRLVIDDPGFMMGEKPGDQFQIGENSGFRGSISYSRPELPDRGWVGAIAFVFGLLAVLPFLGVLVYIKEKVRDLRRRR